MIPEYTIVLGLDAYHLEQLEVTWPTIVKHKPSTARVRKVVFYDGAQDMEDRIDRLLHSPEVVVPWPDRAIDYGQGSTKWDSPQRHKMLAGFLYTAAKHVTTPYWLKIDTDAVATGQDDWIREEWFEGCPDVIGPPWNYTKPATQMATLDRWAERHRLFSTPPLGLEPAPGATLLKHERVAGWCNFFATDMTRWCAEKCADTVGYGQMPVPSLDGLLWYVATRSKSGVRRVRMKHYGWDVRNSMGSVREAAERALA